MIYQIRETNLCVAKIGILSRIAKHFCIYLTFRYKFTPIYIVFYTISDDEREFLERFLAKWQKSVIFAPQNFDRSTRMVIIEEANPLFSFITMDILIIILILLAIIAALVGIIGAIVPALPGPPLCFASLVIAYFTSPGYISSSLLVTMLIITVAVTVLDYIAPIWLTKLGGGSKQAIWGSTIGVFIGLFFMPIGLIVGPLAGAFVGELVHEEKLGKAIRVALMSFIAFLLTTGLKLVVSLVMTYYVFESFAHQAFDFFQHTFNA